MKTRINFSNIFLIASFLLTSLNWSFGQSKGLAQISVKAVEPSAVIKVYQVCDGAESLLVINPSEHSFSYYETAPFNVYWYQDGMLVGQGVWLENVCGQNFTAVIFNYETGWTNSVSYHMGCGNAKETLKPFAEQF